MNPSDLAALTGLLLVTLGVALIYLPAALIVAGALIVALVVVPTPRRGSR